MAIRNRDQALESLFAAKRAGGGNLYGGPPQPQTQQQPQGQAQQPTPGMSVQDQLKALSETGGGGTNMNPGSLLAGGLGTVFGGAMKVLQPVSKSLLLGAEELAEGLSGGEFATQKNADGTLNEFGQQSNWDKINDPEYGFGKLMGDVTDNKWADRTIGFLGDVAFDPLTYVGGGAAKSAGAIGKAGRGALARKAATLNMSDDIIESIGKYGPAYLDDATRESLNVKKAGVYWGIGDASVRLPGTTALGRGTEKTFATIRNGSWGRVAAKRTGRGDPGLELARRATTTGRTIDGVTPAMGARFLTNMEKKASTKGKVRDIFAREAQDLMSGWDDKVRESILHEVERLPNGPAGPVAAEDLARLSPQARQWVTLRDKLYTFAGEKKVSIGNLGGNYVPHRGTREGISFLKNKPKALAWLSSATEGSTATKARKILPDMGPQDIDGVMIDFGDGSLQSIEAAYQKAFPNSGVKKFVQDNAALVMERYIDEIADAVATVDMFKLMMKNGDLGDIRAYTSEMVETAANATKNADVAALLRKQLLARDKEWDKMHKEAWELSQKLADALHKAVDDEFILAGKTQKAMQKDIASIRKDLVDGADKDHLYAKFKKLKEKTEAGYKAVDAKLTDVEESMTALQTQMPTSQAERGRVADNALAQMTEAQEAATLKRMIKLSEMQASLEEQLFELAEARRWADKLEDAVGVRVAASELIEDIAASPDDLRRVTVNFADDEIIEIEKVIPAVREKHKSHRVAMLEERIAKAEQFENGEAFWRLSFDELSEESRRLAWVGDAEASVEALDAVIASRRAMLDSFNKEIKRLDDVMAAEAAEVRKTAPFGPIRPEDALPKYTILPAKRIAALKQEQSKLWSQISNVKRAVKSNDWRQAKRIETFNRRIAAAKANIDEARRTGRVPDHTPTPKTTHERLQATGRRQDDFNKNLVEPTPLYQAEHDGPLLRGGQVQEGWVEYEAGQITEMRKALLELEQEVVRMEDGLSAKTAKLLDGQAGETGYDSKAWVIGREEADEHREELTKLLRAQKEGQAQLAQVDSNPHMLAQDNLRKEARMLRQEIANAQSSRSFLRQVQEAPRTDSKQLRALLVDVKKLEEHDRVFGTWQGTRTVEHIAPKKYPIGLDGLWEEFDDIQRQLSQIDTAQDAIPKLPPHLNEKLAKRGQSNVLTPVTQEEADVIDDLLSGLQKGRKYAYRRLNLAKSNFKKYQDEVGDSAATGDLGLLRKKTDAGQELSPIEKQRLRLADLELQLSRGTITREQYDELHNIKLAGEPGNRAWVEGDGLQEPEFEGSGFEGIFAEEDLLGDMHRYLDDADSAVDPLEPVWAARSEGTANGPPIQSDSLESLSNQADLWLAQAEEESLRAKQRVRDGITIDNEDAIYGSGLDDAGVFHKELLRDDGFNPVGSKGVELSQIKKQAEQDYRDANKAYNEALRVFGIDQAALQRAAPDGSIGDVLLFVPDIDAKKAAIMAKTGRSKANTPWLTEGLFETPQGIRAEAAAKFGDDWDAAKRAYPVETKIGHGGKAVTGFDDLSYKAAATVAGGVAELRRFGHAKHAALPPEMLAANTTNQLKQVIRDMPLARRRQLWIEARDNSARRMDRAGVGRAKLEERLEVITGQILDQQSMGRQLTDYADNLSVAAPAQLGESARGVADALEYGGTVSARQLDLERAHAKRAAISGPDRAADRAVREAEEALKAEVVRKGEIVARTEKALRAAVKAGDEEKIAAAQGRLALLRDEELHARTIAGAERSLAAAKEKGDKAAIAAAKKELASVKLGFTEQAFKPGTRQVAKDVSALQEDMAQAAFSDPQKLAAARTKWSEVDAAATAADEALLKELDETYSTLAGQADRWSAVQKKVGAREAKEAREFDAALKVKEDLLLDTETQVKYLTQRQANVEQLKKDLLKAKNSKRKAKNASDEDLLNRLDEFGSMLDMAIRNPQDMDLVASVRLYDDWMKLSKKMDRHSQATDGILDVYEAAMKGAKGKGGGLALDMQRGMVDGFSKFRSALYPDADDLPIDSKLNEMLNNVLTAVNDDMDLKWFDDATQLFKTYATATPGFHVRNFMGATFMNFSDGVTVKATRRASKLWHEYASDPQTFFTKYEGQDDVLDAFDAVFAIGAGGSFDPGEIGSGVGRALKGVKNNRGTRYSRKFGEDYVEGPVRLAAALDTTMKGGSMGDAAARTGRLHFNYSDLSKFDKNMKRFIPFWTFMSRNLPLQVEQMWRKPKAYAVYNHFMNNFNIGTGEDEYMPEWMREAGAIVGFRGGDGGLWGDGSDTVFMPDLQHTGLQADVEAFGGGNGRWPIVDGLLSSGNPIAAKPLEVAMNRSGFFGGDLVRDYKKSETGRSIEKSDSEKNLERFMHVLEGWITPAGSLQGLMGADVLGGADAERAEANQFQKWLNISGIPLKKLGDRERNQEALRRQFED